MNFKQSSQEPRHAIQVAARRTGLNPDVIRVWERRYSAVAPCRSTTNRRLYSDRDIERLFLLAQVTRAGHRIGDVAALDLEALESMVSADRLAAARTAGAAEGVVPGDVVLPRLLADCLAAIKRLDGSALEALIESAAVELAPPALLEGLLMPMMSEVGRMWSEGSIRITHEHLATSIVRTFLGTQQSRTSFASSAPELIAATPAGQMHELGALMVAVAASTDGWRVTYLGADVPAAELAAAAVTRNARVVALSVVHPADDRRLSAELSDLSRHLNGKADLIVGGAAAHAYEAILMQVGARIVVDISTLRSHLESLRRAPITPR